MKEVQLREVVDVYDNLRKPLSTMTRLGIQGKYPYYSANGAIDSINKFIFSGEYILVAEDGSVRTDDGKPVVKLTKKDEQFWVSNHAHVLRAKEGILNKYLYYNLSQVNVDQIITGAVQLKVSQENLLKLKVKLHSFDEQQHIVDTIGTVDDLIEKNEEIIANARSLINAFYDTIIVETGISILKDFFVITIGRTPPTKESKWFSSSSRGNVKWLSIKDMAQNSTYIFETSQFLTNDALKKFNIPIVKEGDVLLSFKLTVGRTAIAGANMVTNEAIACFKANPEYRNYLFCYLQRCNFLSDGDNTSSIGKAVNSTIIRNFPFVIPSKESLDTFNKETHSLFELIKLKQKENISLKTQKGTLLCKYFSSN